MFTLAGRDNDSFSRAKQLYTIAFEVLHIAEKLECTSERAYWANWADSVLNQMKMEAISEDAWRTCILRSKGRCRLVIGSAFAEEVEAALERGEMDVLDSEEADEARADLALAIELFGRVRAKENENSAGEEETKKEKEKDPPDQPVASKGEEEEEEEEEEGKVEDETHSETEELGVLLTEAFLTLANLTRDPNEREALYAKAKAEAGSEMDLDLDLDAECDDDSDDDGDDKMDESH
jgi:hypothetical protein